MDFTLTIQDSIQRAIDRFLELRTRPQNEAFINQLEDEFVEEITRQEKEWVKERRVEYLWDEIHRLLGDAYPYMLTIENENLKWFDEFIFEDEIDPRFIKVRYCIFQINMWNEKKFIEPARSITDQEIAMAKEIPIETLFEGNLRRSGSTLIGLCQFHNERHGSFVIYLKQNRWHCFGACGDGGDSIYFIQKKYNVNFINAIKILLGI